MLQWHDPANPRGPTADYYHSYATTALSGGLQDKLTASPALHLTPSQMNPMTPTKSHPSMK